MKMKKIKNDKQLQHQKKQLLKRQKELEQLLHANWMELKLSLSPKNLAGEILAKAFHSKPVDGNNVLADSLGEFASLLTKAAVEKAQEKLNEWLKTRH
jgi:hypothetical protein